MADGYIKEWHSRDLDALMLPREVVAVKEWLSSNATIHIMRDHPKHKIEILGGMFGIKQDTAERKKMALEKFEEMIKKFGEIWKKGNDQTALAAIVTKVAKSDSLVHDAYHCTSNLVKGSIPKPWPSKRDFVRNDKNKTLPNFVGNTGWDGIAFECPPECRPKDHQDWKIC